ncbi:TerD family protein [Pseudobacillus sp. FSL P4-0506]|uniref:TerD family protein n=1 Tax=Pseudobacillus sp. FSL P4-0506 TaxID=2921576 RepID=UPI0030F561BA
MNLVKGARADITKNEPGLDEIIIQVSWEADPSLDIDASIFMIDESGKCPGDPYMIFYGNASSANQSVCHSVNSQSSEKTESFSIKLDTIEPIVQKLVLTLTIFEGEQKGQTFAQMNHASMKILNKKNGTELIHYDLGPFTVENSLVVAEAYRRNGGWKISANTGGFAGGLAQLCQHFGLEVAEETEPTASMKQAQKEAAPAIENENINVDQAPSVIQLSKITLEKPGDSISLKKADKIKHIAIKLQWTKGVDLDMHAFYKTKNRRIGHIFFGNKGKANESPYIALDKDAGVGNKSGHNEENLVIKTLEDIESVIIATNIFRFLRFKKDDNFAKYDGKVTIKTNTGDEIDVPLTSEEPGRWCVISKIDNSHSSAPKVININRVQKGEPSIDKY